MFLGIDPGLNGGYAVLRHDGSILHTAALPKNVEGRFDLVAFNDIIDSIAYSPSGLLRSVTVYLEQVHGRGGPGAQWGAAGTFNFGAVFGAIEMCLVANELKYKLVSPQTWARKMHNGVWGKMDSKKRSLIAVQKLFPDVDLRASKRARIPHDGIVDALLIAEYGRRQEKC